MPLSLIPSCASEPAPRGDLPHVLEEEAPTDAVADEPVGHPPAPAAEEPEGTGGKGSGETRDEEWEEETQVRDDDADRAEGAKADGASEESEAEEAGEEEEPAAAGEKGDVISVDLPSREARSAIEAAYTAKQLRQMLKERGLPSNGPKSDLVLRLSEAGILKESAVELV